MSLGQARTAECCGGDVGGEAMLEDFIGSEELDNWSVRAFGRDRQDLNVRGGWAARS